MRQTGRILWPLAWLATLPIAVGRAGILGDSDTLWEIRTGRLILDTHRIPATDPFSWTAYGRTWHPNSWAFDVLLAWVYRPGTHLVGVALTGIALTMLAIAAQLLLAARFGAHPVGVGLLVLLATPVPVAWFSVRPQLVDYAAVPLLLVLTEVALSAPRDPGAAPHEGRGAARSGRGRRLAALAGIAALQAVWVNVHATAPLGIALAAVAGAVTTVTDRRLWPAAGPTLAAAVGTLANPYGIGVLRQGLSVHDASTGLINEWMPIDVRQPFMDLAILVGLGAVAMTVRRRWWRPAAVLLVLVVAGIAVRRFQPILAVCAIPLLAAALDTPAARRYAASRRVMLRIGAALLLAAYLFRAAVAVPGLGRVGFPYAPVAALPAGCRLFNSYDLGGVVILRRPDVPVSLDSRNDLYGRREVIDSVHLLDARTGGAARLAARGITCVLVRPSSRLGRQLTADPGWQVAARDKDAAAYIKR